VPTKRDIASEHGGGDGARVVVCDKQKEKDDEQKVWKGKQFCVSFLCVYFLIRSFVRCIFVALHEREIGKRRMIAVAV